MMPAEFAPEAIAAGPVFGFNRKVVKLRLTEFPVWSSAREIYISPICHFSFHGGNDGYTTALAKPFSVGEPFIHTILYQSSHSLRDKSPSLLYRGVDREKVDLQS